MGYAATLLEHGVQVDNIYVSDVHGDHTAAQTGDLGPGEQTYEQQLQAYDTAFGQFFTRLAHDGITPANTLFSVTTDEGDHFSGSAPTPADCTGTPGNYCTYATRSEVNVNLPGLLATEQGDTTPFAIHSDPAPALWVTGNPSAASAPVRQLDRDISALSVVNPLTGQTDRVAYQLADPVEEKILHFVSSDPARTPTLTGFSGEDEYVGERRDQLHEARASTPRRASRGTTAVSGPTCRTSGRRTPDRGCRPGASTARPGPTRSTPGRPSWPSSGCATTTPVTAGC